MSQTVSTPTSNSPLTGTQGAPVTQTNPLPPILQGITTTPQTNNNALVAGGVGPNGPLLPKPQTSTTSPTGVATSDLATQTTATQKTGLDNVNARIATNAQNQPQVSYTTLLSNALTASGKPTDFASKAALAQQAGIQNYVGSQQQDAQLYGYLNNQANTGTQNGSTGPSGGSTSSTTGSSDTNGTQTPPTGAAAIYANNPGNAYNAPLNALNSQLNSNYTSQTNLLNTYINNPLSLLNSAQTANLQAVQNQFSAIAEQQAIANKSYLGQVTEAGAREGLEITSPQQYFANQQEAISKGLQDLNSLAATAATTVAGLQQSFIDKDYTAINAGYTELQSNLESQISTQQALQKNATDLYTASLDYNQKAEEFTQSQAQQQSEFEQTQGLELQKLALQYPDIDPSTGQVKAGTDPTTIPGVVALPGGGYAFSEDEAKNVGGVGSTGSYETFTNANGYGVIPTGQMTAYTQAAGALTGVQTAIQNGTLNPNGRVSSDIQDKIPPSLLTQWFGTTDPTAINAVLGKGGASVPDLKNMTWSQAAQFLQSNVNQITGTTPEKSSATQGANTFISVMNNGVSTSVTSNPTLGSIFGQLNSQYSNLGTQ